jgi:Rrf2 family protein
VVHLARLWPHNYIQSKDLSKEENLPGKFLEAILLALRRGGFLESKVGSGGGYRLSRSPRDIRVGEIVRRLEGRLTIKDGALEAEGSPGEIAVHLINVKLTQATDDVLDKLSVEELTEQAIRGGNPQQSMYYI